MRHKRSTLARILGNVAITAIGLALLVATSPAQAQTIYAMTQSGNYGTLNVSTGVFTQISSPGFEPAGIAGLGANMFAANYGSGGTLYEINPINGNFVTIGTSAVSYYDFGGTTSGLYAIGTDQNLYLVNAATGATTLIGPTGLGSGGYQSMSGGAATLYTAVPDVSGQFTLLYSINTTTGLATEVGNTGIAADVSSIGFANGVLYAADITGNLYTLNPSNGMATLIGNSGQDLWGLGFPPMTYSVLHNFTGEQDGANPIAGLTINASGNLLYGTAAAGGGGGDCSYDDLTGCGTLFRLVEKNGSWLTTPLYSFEGGSADGEFPVRPVTIGSNGSVYGAAMAGGEGTCSYDGATGCGIVFNASPPATAVGSLFVQWSEKRLYHFTGESDGGTAFTTLLFNSAGDIFGTTFAGGTHGDGTVFELVPAGGGNYTESAIYSFAGGTDGSQPLDGLIADSSGNLYGTTAAGGSTTACAGEGCGIVFELTPSGNSWTENILYRFQGGTDGKNPNSGVVMDAMGNLYGNTWQGGSGGGGTVWELSPSGGGNYTFHLLYSVPVSGFAVGRVVLDSTGNLYNALQNGGGFGAGQIFQLKPSNGNWIYVDLYDFTGGTDGANAIGGVVLDSSDNMYGTATFGGANATCGSNGSTGCGDVWRITPN